jgi:hypothetical protein
MNNDKLHDDRTTEDESSCDPSLTRSQFIKALAQRAAVSGAILIAPAIADMFVAPPAIAATSGGGGGMSSVFT